MHLYFEVSVSGNRYLIDNLQPCYFFFYFLENNVYILYVMLSLCDLFELDGQPV